LRSAAEDSIQTLKLSCGLTAESLQMVQGGSNSVVESQPSKLLVAGSIPVSRSKYLQG
jgi:hypothetical protein